MSEENLFLLRSRQPNARFILYNWDAVTTHDFRPYIGYFDRVFTFDPRDAAELNISYLPLFATRRYQNLFGIAREQASVYFIGNIVNPQRYRVVEAFEDFCARNRLSFQKFLSTTVHGYTEMLKAGIRPSGVSFRQVSDSKQDQMIRNSAAAFDFANHVQVGFTMRVMENLCAGRKIITNNKHILGAPFFSPDRILLYEGLDFSAVPDFLATPIVEPDRRFLEYSVQEFSATLISERI
jgi:hypothetical protein